MQYVFSLFFSLTTLNCLWSQTRYYVSQSEGNDINDGLSWANSFATIQQALTIIGNDDTIWVAQGIYSPDKGGPGVIGDRSSSFYLYKGVNLYGGFAGHEVKLNERDWKLNATILSGDLNQDDGPNFQNYGENSHHVVACVNQNKIATLDGFTISGGNANVQASNFFMGAGMYNLNSAPRVLNCQFKFNYAIGPGGGMENSSADPVVEGCAFIGNYGINGGAMRNLQAAPQITQSTFIGNRGSSGAGIYNYTSHLIMDDCTLDDNIADTGQPNTSATGGGIYNFLDSKADITNTSFLGNAADFGGGFHNTHSEAFFTNVVFLGNQAKMGGGLYNAGDSTRIINCTFTGNYALFDGGAIRNHLHSPIVINTVIWNNADQTGVGTAGASMSTVGAIPVMIYDLIQNITVNLGGNIDGIMHAGDANYPSFVLPADPMSTPHNIGDTRPTLGSVLLNIGNNGHNPLAIDRDGNPRKINTIDFGAYEHKQTSCPDQLLINPVLSPLKGLYEAANGIETVNQLTVDPNKEVTLRAPMVELQPEFEVACDGALTIVNIGCGQQ